MIEDYLLQIGMRCGTVKNFNNVIIEDMKLKRDARWYFLTPIKSTTKASGLKECNVSIAFPFEFQKNDDSEQTVLDRLKEIAPSYEKELLKALRARLIVSNYTFSLIPFWANEKGSDRAERKDFGQTRIHLLNFVATIQYRESWFNCTCS